MKFGKSLSNQIEGTIPEWRDKFLSYKELKKTLKLVEPKCNDNGGLSKRIRLIDDVSSKVGVISSEEIDFITLLEAEVEKFNGFFEEKEEEYIITLKELQDSVAMAKESSEELIKIRREIVDFHGEMVLLENYSAFNYTGLVKILKKYDKRTGALLRLPFIQKVLQQPFFTMDLLYKLIKECENMLEHLFPSEPSVPSTDRDGDAGYNPDLVPTNKDGVQNVPRPLTEIEYMESLYMKSAVSALRVLQEIRSGSSTVSAFSLPPMQNNVLEETWNKIPVLEQVAK
ncbi:Spx domain-containing protein [Thalictrum thalictroides]|uniref:Spx domain-containing protein n=1 Tax=Thalictrum thalictroides TaxID=46969 RepID=A0A7J6W4N5_THATH|nr:Spx domain-containing protein [Thalictrum thalictroides]